MPLCPRVSKIFSLRIAITATPSSPLVPIDETHAAILDGEERSFIREVRKFNILARKGFYSSDIVGRHYLQVKSEGRRGAAGEGERVVLDRDGKGRETHGRITRLTAL